MANWLNGMTFHGGDLVVAYIVGTIGGFVLASIIFYEPKKG